ncbi:hypothetical protein E5163_12125 [Marinicauda algicola]|uniref:Uncharacterized protein n=1 Tax=Marinicauda algicola TaxID=2029849 RepID=A0A4S2GZN5_9PROT|nr:hypothetical protein [Marinicauda algicola]TGY88553.1 hypothetical protein E5163_12125 [Marinicauda algicola]
MADRYSESKPFKNPAKTENAPFDDPADDQVEAEAFDEDKHLGREDQRRPARGDADPGRVPVDEGIAGGRGERFGEQLPRGRETTDALDEVTVEQERLAEKAQRKAEESKSRRDKDVMSQEEKVDEAMKETFPASDSPSFTPGKPK